MELVSAGYSFGGRERSSWFVGNKSASLELHRTLHHSMKTVSHFLVRTYS